MNVDGARLVQHAHATYWSLHTASRKRAWVKATSTGQEQLPPTRMLPASPSIMSLPHAGTEAAGASASAAAAAAAAAVGARLLDAEAESEMAIAQLLEAQLFSTR